MKSSLFNVVTNDGKASYMPNVVKPNLGKRTTRKAFCFMIGFQVTKGVTTTTYTGFQTRSMFAGSKLHRANR
jgi:hypothetical protein